MDYPAKSSVGLGIRLVTAGVTDIDAQAVEELRLLTEVFLASEEFMETFRLCQVRMEFDPISKLPGGRPIQLLTIMAKMFHAGWAAGRQEMMAAEIARAANSANEPS